MNVMYCIVETRILFDYFMSIGEADYKLNNSQLEKDLGVTFETKLNLATIYMK